MRSFGLLLAGAAYATEDGVMAKPNCWPSNGNAEYCGCQFITDLHQMINATCTATFTTAPHFLSVASSFPMPEASDVQNNVYAWTGFQGNSHDQLHDLLYFFEPADCEATVAEMDDPKYHPTITCTPNVDSNGDSFADPEIRLGNFVYDIARSVQRYNLPIKNLGQGETVTVQINKQNSGGNYLVEGIELKNVTEHHGHGDASAEDCTNGGQFVFTQNADHWGDLEYAQFDVCDTGAEGVDYDWDVPSSWTSTVTA